MYGQFNTFKVRLLKIRVLKSTFKGTGVLCGFIEMEHWLNIE